MKATLEFMEPERIVSSARGTVAILCVDASANDYLVGTLIKDSLNRWMFRLGDGNTIAVYPGDRVALMTNIKIVN